MRINEISRNLLSYLLTFLFCVSNSNILALKTYGDNGSDISSKISIDFKGKNLEDLDDNTQCCMFPELEINSENSNILIHTIQISYSGNDLTNSEIILPDEELSSFDKKEGNELDWILSTDEGKSPTDIAKFLQKVQYKFKKYQSVSILLSTEKIPSNVHYYPGTGHFYETVSYLDEKGDQTSTYNFKSDYKDAKKRSWLTAYNDAKTRDFAGWKGYLACVTSEGENAFIQHYANAVWLGGTRARLVPEAATDSYMKNYIDAIGTDEEAKYEHEALTNSKVKFLYDPQSHNNPFSTVTDYSDTKVYDYWYWAGGPEAAFTPNNPNWAIGDDKHEHDITKDESEDGKYAVSGTEVESEESSANSDSNPKFSPKNSVFYPKTKYNDSDQFSDFHYRYVCWTDGEPNNSPNYGGIEYCLSTSLDDSGLDDSGTPPKLWNDLAGLPVTSYKKSCNQPDMS